MRIYFGDKMFLYSLVQSNLYGADTLTTLDSVHLLQGVHWKQVPQNDNKKWGSIGLFLSSEHLMPKLRLFVAGHIVAMVTCYIEKKDDQNLFTND